MPVLHNMGCTLGDIVKYNIQRKNKVQNPERNSRADVLLKWKIPLRGVWVYEQGFKKKGQLLRI